MGETMGKSKSHRYRIEAIDKTGMPFRLGYDHKLSFFEEFIRLYNYSVTNGVNKHIGEIGKISSCKLIDQRSQVVKRIFNASEF